MVWTERQHALLRGLGLRVWTPPVRAQEEAAAATGHGTSDGAGNSAGSGRVDTRVPAAADSATRTTVAAPTAASAAVTTPSARQTLPTAARTAPAPAASSPVGVARAEAPVAAGEQALGDRTARIASLDWPALRDAVADCSACGLCASRTQTVFGTGSLRAQWLVVGEAPGEQEDRQGLPFVGPSGELLDAMLRALDLTRAEDGPASEARRVYIANTLKCRPPGNRNPAPDELMRCEPFLVRQIALLKPRIILAMGRYAVQSLLRSSEPVGRLRGRVHTYQGVPLVVTYHPAYLLRNPSDKARAWDDLCLAASTAEQAG
jgi:uracil-DNA glycosylase